ncbi:MAG: hypothetical protein N2445_05815, partial [Acidobacteria bacterium]|nr:hypothetical protein [Acidobacteriota bacterium]
MKKNFILLIALMSGFFAFSQEMKFGIRISQDNFQTAKEIVEKFPQDKNNPIFLTLQLNENWEKEDMSLLKESVIVGFKNNYLVNVCVPVPKASGEERLLPLVSLSENLKGYVNSFELSARKEDFSEEERATSQRLAFAIKRISVSLRGESQAKIYLGPFDSEYLTFIEPLYSEELIAYIDGYFTHDVDSAGEPPSEVTEFLQKY